MTKVMLLCDLSLKGVVRAALWDDSSGLSEVEQFLASDAAGFERGILAYLEAKGSPFIAGAAMAAPGFEQNGIQHMPNHGYELDRDWLRKVLNVQRLHFVNPTVARALSIPDLRPEDCETIGDGLADPDETKCIVGTGPGLGMAILVQDSLGGWTAFAGAGGHADLTTTDATEFALRTYLAEKFGHVSLSRVVSLNGLIEIWDALRHRDDVREARPESAEQIVAMARSGDARAQEAISLCMTWLARGASDMVLMTGARGGVYLSGELVNLLDEHIDRKAFVKTFTEKGRLSSYMEAIPINILKSGEPEFLGLSTLFA